MTREAIKHKIDEILIKELDLPKNYFNSKENGGEDLVMKEEWEIDHVRMYLITSKIEETLDLLVNDQHLNHIHLTYRELIDTFYNEYLRERRGY